MYTNPVTGDSLTFDSSGSNNFFITSIEGLSPPDASVQEQKAPFQDGSSYIDELLGVREVTMRGILKIVADLAQITTLKRQVINTLNPKDGPGTIIYTDSLRSYEFSGLPHVEFGNKNFDKIHQDFQVTFYCNDPYLYDTAETVTTLSGQFMTLNIANDGDVETPFRVSADYFGRKLSIANSTTGASLNLDDGAQSDKHLELDTAFGNKIVRMTWNDLFSITGGSVKLVYSENEGIFLTCCSTGIFTSIDGLNWVYRSPIVATSATYAPNLRMWVVCTATGVVYTSTDLLSWAAALSVTSGAFASVYYSTEQGVMIAVGSGPSSSDLVYSSPDGVTWTSHSTGINIAHKDVVFAAGLNKWFIASGTHIFSSADGIIWTQQSATANAMVWSSTLGVLLYLTNSAIYSSTNGTSWTAHTTGVPTTSGIWCTELSLFFVCGDGNVPLLTSPDGNTWTSLIQNELGLMYPTSIVYSKRIGKLTVSGPGFSQSIDGVTWSNQTGITQLSPGPGYVKYMPAQAKWIGGNPSLISDDAKVWSPIGGTLYSAIGYHAGTTKFVIAAEHGIFIQSVDGGSSWKTSRFVNPMASNLVVKNLMYSAVISKWVAVGSAQTNLAAVVTSPDGVTWTKAFIGNSSKLTFFMTAENATTIVAVGDNSIHSSINGTTWTSRNTGNQFYGVTWAPSINLFCAVGAGVIFTSPDGITWTSRSTAHDLRNITWAPSLSLFVSVGIAGKIVTSPDGTTWTVRTSGVSQNLEMVAWNASKAQFIAGGQNASASVLLYSTNGTAWNAATPPSTGNLGYDRPFRASSDNSIWIIVWDSGQGTNYRIARSTNGIAWTAPYPVPPRVLSSAADDGKIVAGSGIPGGPSHVSLDDGVTWKELSGVQSFRALAYSSNVELWVGADATAGYIYSSDDGIVWYHRSTLSSGAFVYADNLNLWIAVLESSAAKSRDGISWTEITSASFSGSSPKAIAWSPKLNILCVVGSNGRICTSIDGNTWIARTSGTVADIIAVVYSVVYGLFIATTLDGKILLSSDGIVWTIRTGPAMGAIRSIDYSEMQDKFVLAVDSLGIVSGNITKHDANAMNIVKPGSKFFSFARGNNVVSVSVDSGSMSGTIRFRRKYLGA